MLRCMISTPPCNSDAFRMEAATPRIGTSGKHIISASLCSKQIPESCETGRDTIAQKDSPRRDARPRRGTWVRLEDGNYVGSTLYQKTICKASSVGLIQVLRWAYVIGSIRYQSKSYSKRTVDTWPILYQSWGFQSWLLSKDRSFIK